MKKLILSVGLLGMLSFGAQDGFAQTEKQTQQNEAADFPAPPKFESEKANAGLQEFTTIIKEYAPAIRSNDTSKMQEFGMKVQSWQQNAASWATELSQEEQAQMQAYMQELGQVLQPAAPAPPAKDSAE